MALYLATYSCPDRNSHRSTKKLTPARKPAMSALTNLTFALGISMYAPVKHRHVMAKLAISSRNSTAGDRNPNGSREWSVVDMAIEMPADNIISTGNMRKIAR